MSGSFHFTQETAPGETAQSTEHKHMIVHALTVRTVTVEASEGRARAKVGARAGSDVQPSQLHVQIHRRNVLDSELHNIVYCYIIMILEVV